MNAIAPQTIIIINSKRQQAFTLIELLVAVSVFAVMSVMIFGGLSEVLSVRTATDKHVKKLTELQLTFMYLGKDIRQIANRSVRDQYGSSIDALISSDLGQYKLELTRAGHPNPAGFERSNLQRVAYGVEEDKLYRYYWKVLDRASDSEPVKRVLLNGVSRLSFNYLDVNDSAQGTSSWRTTWPPQTNPKVFPVVVEVVLEVEEWGTFKRFFNLPTV